MFIGMPSFFGQRNIDYTPVFFSSFPGHVALLYQTVHGYGQGSHRHGQLFGNHRHILGFSCANGLDHMHIVICNILEFLRDDGLLL